MKYHHGLTESEAVAWSVAFVVMGTIVMVINTLTLLTFIKTRSLRARKHVMIINLTAADLLFGVTGMSSTVIYFLKPSEISFCVQNVINRLTKMTSLITIGALAVERMHAIVFPLRHKVLLTHRVYKIALILIWSIASVTTTFVMFFKAGIWRHDIISSTAIVQLIVGIGLISVIVSCYVIIWISLRRRNRRKLGRLSLNQDKTLAATLLIVAGGFIITWFPPALYLSIANSCKKCIKPNGAIGFGVLLLLGIQSLINPIIYCFRLPRFKFSLKVLVKRMICLGMCLPNEVTPKRRATIHPERQAAHICK